MLLEQDFPRIQVFNEIYTVQVKNTLQTNIACLDTSGVSGNSRSRTFPRMYASDSLSRISGMDFFIPFPFPNFGNGLFSFPSRSRILGMDFFIPFPFPNFGNAFFLFPSRSQILGMVFFHSLPVPKFWEWFFFHSLPFPKLWEWN